MKSIFGASEYEPVAKLWAAQSQPEAATRRALSRDGYNYVTRMYFKGRTIFSYGSHFPLATWYEVNGRKFVVANSERHGVTTSTHMAYVLGVIPKGVPVIYSPEPEHPEAMKARALSVIEECADAAINARRWFPAAQQKIATAVYQANAYAELIGARWRVRPPEYTRESLQAFKRRRLWAKRNGARLQRAAAVWWKLCNATEHYAQAA